MTATVKLVQSKRIKVVNRKLIPLSRLKNAPHNPPSRIEPRNLRELVDSLDMIGLLAPVTVNFVDEIIDGHRRVAAAKLLGWIDIECNVIGEDSAAVYASVNATPRKMSGSDTLNVWLANPAAVPSRTGAQIQGMVADIGKVLAQRIADKGYSIRVYQTARRICRYCDDTDSETVKAVIAWLIDVATIGQVMKAMESGESPALIMQAVKRGKPVVFRLTISE